MYLKVQLTEIIKLGRWTIVKVNNGKLACLAENFSILNHGRWNILSISLFALFIFVDKHYANVTIDIIHTYLEEYSKSGRKLHSVQFKMFLLVYRSGREGLWESQLDRMHSTVCWKCTFSVQNRRCISHRAQRANHKQPDNSCTIFTYSTPRPG